MHFHLTTVICKAMFYFMCFSIRTVSREWEGHVQDIHFTLDASSELHFT